LDEGFLDNFHQIHLETYAHADRSAAIEIVNLRLRATGLIPSPRLQQSQTKAAIPPTPSSMQHCVSVKIPETGNQFSEIPLFIGEDLSFGHEIVGPAIIVKSDTTIYLQAGDQAIIDAYRNVIVSLA
jgi:N-methylhydantoinase A